MILYHVISFFQLYSAVVHKYTFHKNSEAVLILPDFIKEKQFQENVLHDIFSNVYYFPYLQLPHIPRKLKKNVQVLYDKYIGEDIKQFTEINVFGAHFYFSYYLILKKKHFNFFEDGTGIYTDWQRIYKNLYIKFPAHAKFAKRQHLFDGENKYINNRYLNLNKQLNPKKLIDIDENMRHYDAITCYMELISVEQKSILNLFGIDHKMKFNENTTILLTEHLFNLCNISKEEQELMYRLIVGYFVDKDEYLIIKNHPDDTIDYNKHIKISDTLNKNFPVELMASEGHNEIRKIITISSTSILNFDNTARKLSMGANYEKDIWQINYCYIISQFLRSMPEDILCNNHVLSQSCLEVMSMNNMYKMTEIDNMSFNNSTKSIRILSKLNMFNMNRKKMNNFDIVFILDKVSRLKNSICIEITSIDGLSNKVLNKQYLTILYQNRIEMKKLLKNELKINLARTNMTISFVQI